VGALVAVDAPQPVARDEAVDNQARNNHDMPGYLEIGVVRDAIVVAAG